MAATPQNLSITSLAAAGAQDHIAMFTPIAIDKDTCSLVTLQMQVITTNAVATASADRYFHVNTNGFGSFYSDSGCTTPTNSVTMTSGTSYAKIYYKTSIDVPTGRTGSILGFSNNTTANPTSSYPTANTNVTHGNMNFAQPRGMAVYEVSSVVKGFFISSYNHHRIYFMNNNAGTLSIGGNSVPSNYGGVVVGGNAAAFDTDGDGVATRLNTPTALSMSADNNSVLVADQLNYRVRALDLTNAGDHSADIYTLIGSGYPRAGTAGTATTAANSAYFSAPIGLAMDSTTKTLYIADSGNKYIRSLSTLTGQLDTAVGTGLSATAPNDGSTPTNVTINSPRGMAIHSMSGGKKFLLFADTQTATANTLYTDNGNGGTDRHNHVGSINLGVTGTLFSGGSSFVTEKYNTAIGDYGLGNAPYGGAGGTTISYGANTNTAISFFSVDDVASDGTNIYVVSRADHCIVKVGADGSSSVVVGQADGSGSKCRQTSTTAVGFPTATTSSGQARTITIRAPTAVVVDPRYAGDGNFFFADSPDVAGGSTIRYANFRATGVNVGSDYVNGTATPGEAYVKTLTFVNYMNPASSYAWVTDLAAITTTEAGGNVTQFCVSGGRHDDAMLGTHHVTCYSLDDSVTPGTQSLRLGGIPGSTLSIRSGASLGVEQEGVNASATLLFSPSGLAFDSTGNLFISERGNHTIRFVRKWWQ
jgi:hypothetical protein